MPLLSRTRPDSPAPASPPAAPASDPPVVPVNDPPPATDPQPEEPQLSLEELAVEIDKLGKVINEFEEQRNMSNDNFKLTDEERELLTARRQQREAEEAARIEREKIPNVLAMNAADYNKLTPEQKSAMFRQNLAAALARE